MSIAPMLVIKASAGTGKTYKLSSQFLELILQGARPDTILATTFTRKAAGEIRTRIVMRLVDAIVKGVPAVDGYTMPQHYAALEQLLAFHHRLSIGTLDSFFINLAKIFPFELNLPTSFALLGQEEQEAHWESVVETLLRSTPPEELIAVLQDIQPESLVGTIHDVAARIAPLYEMFSSGGPMLWRPLTGGALLSRDDCQRLSALLKEESFCPRTKADKPDSRWLKAIGNLCQALERSDFKTILSGGIGGALFADTNAYYGVALTEAQRVVLHPIVEHARALALAYYNQKNEGIRTFIEKIAQARAQILSRGSGWTFNDVTKAVARVVEHEPLSALFYRLDTKLHHVMLDEFQDTSLEQFKIFLPLIDELASKANGTDASFFCVGDSKQAIYSWRGGDKKVFENISTLWPHITVESMSVCRRCRSAILDVTNEIFSRVAGLEGLGAAAKAVQGEFELHTAHETDTTGKVVITKIDEGADEETELFRDVINQIKDLHALGYFSIAVLTRDKKQIAQCVSALRAHGIDAQDESRGVALTQSSIVALFISLLRFIDIPDPRSAYLYHLTSSVLQQVINRYATPVLFATAMRERIGAPGGSLEAMLRELIQYFDPASVASDPFLQKCWSYITAQDHTLRRLSEIASTLEKITITPPREAGAHAVRVMTIHTSKGLEFDAVLLPFLS